MTFFSFLCAGLVFLNSLLHFFLILGFPFGEFVNGGKYRVVPPDRRGVNLFFMLFFLLCTHIYLVIGQIVSAIFPYAVYRYSLLFLAAFFFFAIIGNIRFTNSHKEKIVMIPLSVICFVGSLYLFTFA